MDSLVAKNNKIKDNNFIKLVVVLHNEKANSHSEFKKEWLWTQKFYIAQDRTFFEINEWLMKFCMSVAESWKTILSSPRQLTYDESK